ncbi:Hypothetical protein HVR_LOCUS66 [uncultured virus]|nr:Hypothetical protein HVR_LOCUS66 [uncultured virus]
MSYCCCSASSIPGVPICTDVAVSNISAPDDPLTTYRLRVINNGPYPALSVYLNLTISAPFSPAGLAGFQAFITSQGWLVGGGSGLTSPVVVIIFIGDLGVGEFRDFAITGIPIPSTVRAEVSSLILDCDPLNNIIIISRTPDLNV